MGEDVLPKRLSGQTNDADWFNILRRILAEDLVPRDSNGVPTDLGGALGSSTFRFLNACLLGVRLYGGSNKVTLTASSSLVTDYDITLPPTLPSETSFLGIDSSGVSKFVTPDNVMLRIASSLLEVINGSVTRIKLNLNQSISSSCGVFATINGEAQITNFSISLTTTGRPVMLMVIPDGSANDASFTTSGGAADIFRFKRDGTTISQHSAFGLPASVGKFRFLDVVAAGTYTYTATIAASATDGNFSYAKLIATEL